MLPAGVWKRSVHSTQLCFTQYYGLRGATRLFAAAVFTWTLNLGELLTLVGGPHFAILTDRRAWHTRERRGTSGQLILILLSLG